MILIFACYNILFINWKNIILWATATAITADIETSSMEAPAVMCFSIFSSLIIEVAQNELLCIIEEYGDSKVSER